VGVGDGVRLEDDDRREISRGEFEMETFSCEEGDDEFRLEFVCSVD
jgi:hypothetical protein